MGKLLRERTVNLDYRDEVVLVKWSTMKLLHILAQISDVSKDGLEGVYDQESGKFRPVEIVKNLLAAIGDHTNIVLSIISESAKDLSIDAVGELDPEDLLEVMTGILELNLSEGLGKKLKAFLAAFVTKSATVAKAARTEETEETSSSK